MPVLQDRSYLRLRHREAKSWQSRRATHFSLCFLQEPGNICEQDAGLCFGSSRAETKAFPLPYCSAGFMLSCKDFTARMNLHGSFGSYTDGNLPGEQHSQETRLETQLVWSGSTAPVLLHWVWCSIPSICWEKQSCFPSTHFQPHHSCFHLWEQQQGVATGRVSKLIKTLLSGLVSHEIRKEITLQSHKPSLCLGSCSRRSRQDHPEMHQMRYLKHRTASKASSIRSCPPSVNLLVNFQSIAGLWRCLKF